MKQTNKIKKLSYEMLVRQLENTPRLHWIASGYFFRMNWMLSIVKQFIIIRTMHFIIVQTVNKLFYSVF